MPVGYGDMLLLGQATCKTCKYEVRRHASVESGVMQVLYQETCKCWVMKYACIGSGDMQMLGQVICKCWVRRHASVGSCDLQVLGQAQWGEVPTERSTDHDPMIRIFFMLEAILSDHCFKIDI
jgi:hypothetical protein